MSLITKPDQNMFSTMCLSLYNILYDEIDIKHRKLTTDPHRWLFGKSPKPVQKEDMDHPIGLYTSISAIIKEYNSASRILSDEDTFFAYVLDYAIFLRTMEKTIQYTNCSEKHTLYADTSENEDCVSLTYHTDDCKITIKFEESKINNILSKQSSIIYDNPDSKLKFVDITIDRFFGKEMTSKIRYVYPEGSPQLKDNSDIIMYHNVLHVFRKEMKSLLFEILNSICESFEEGLSGSIDTYVDGFWGEIVENGLYYAD